MYVFDAVTERRFLYELLASCPVKQQAAIDECQSSDAWTCVCLWCVVDTFINPAMSQPLIGFRCKDFVMVAATGTAGHYYIKITDHDDSITPLDENKMLALGGEVGDRVNFSSVIKTHLASQRIKAHDRKCSTPAAASLIRTVLAQALRRGPYQVNTLLAGYDGPLSEFDDAEPRGFLYYMDYLGTMDEVPFGAHGYGATFAMAILDEQWREDMTPQQGIDLMQKCIDEIRKRLVMANEHFTVKCVTATGIQVLDNVH